MVDIDDRLDHFNEVKVEIVTDDYYFNTKYSCRKCHGTHMEVFGGEYVTAIQCVKCKKLEPVHQG